MRIRPLVRTCALPPRAAEMEMGTPDDGQIPWAQFKKVERLGSGTA